MDFFPHMQFKNTQISKNFEKKKILTNNTITETRHEGFETNLGPHSDKTLDQSCGYLSRHLALQDPASYKGPDLVEGHIVHLYAGLHEYGLQSGGHAHVCHGVLARYSHVLVRYLAV